MRWRTLHRWPGGKRTRFRNDSNISDGAWRSAGMPGAQASKNALAHAVFFTRLGELRDRSFENQHDRASGLNLVVAAIILWNTVYVWRQDARLERDEFRGLLPQSVP